MPGSSAQDIIDYCNTWYAAVSSGGSGYLPGLYIGYDVGLSQTQLYEKLLFQHYWSAFHATPVARRGYQMLQLPPLDREVAGAHVDVDVTQQDALGGSVQWLAPVVKLNT